MGSDNQTPMVERYQTRADQVVAMARRHAEEIRANAEEEAERVLLEAEREASRRSEERSRQAEQLRSTAEEEAQHILLEAEREARRRREESLEADRRERARLAIDKRQIEESLDATVAAVARIRELIAAFPSEAGQQGEVLESDSAPSSSVPATTDLPSRRHRVMNFVAVVLAVWATVMVATLIVLPGKAGSTDTTATAATEATGTTAAAIAPAPPASPVVVPPAVAPAAKRSTASSTTDVASARPSDDQALIVAFVAARDCWITIATDDGTWNERVLKASERHVVRASEVVSFKAGNAGALSVLINDRPTAPLGGEGRVVTRRITRENYRSFLAS